MEILYKIKDVMKSSKLKNIFKLKMVNLIAYKLDQIII